MKYISLHRHNKGDTIIEVLIAIAIVSLTLGSAYAVASRTLKNARQAQEHTEALKLLEGQLERMKGLSTDAASPIYTGAPVFCISSAGAFTPIAGASLPAASYPAACSFGSVAGGGYQMGIVRGSNNVFTAKANWAGPTGNQEEVSLIYRIYP